jgi:hypothetical protein
VRYWTRVLPVALLAVVSACAGNHLRPPPSGSGAATPSAAVEEFLKLGEQKNYVQMGWIFGTKDGPVIQHWPRPEMEKRMYALATVLQNESFGVGSGSPVPGRIGEAIRFSVQLIRDRGNVSVPFTTVKGPRDRWYVEQVDLQAVTSPSTYR